MESRLAAISAPGNHANEADKSAWKDTTVVVLNGVSGLLSTYLHVLTSHANFECCWKSLLDHFVALMKCGNLEINTAIFMGLKRVLAQANTNSDSPSVLDDNAQALVWDLWADGLPLPNTKLQTSSTTNQACLTAYVSSLQEIYRLIQDKVNVEQTKRILELLRETIRQASAEAYSADVEYLTALQTQVLDSLKLIRTDIPGVPSAMIMQAAELVGLAFAESSDEELSRKNRPTYVALSKAAMLLVEQLVLTHATDDDIYKSSALTSALVALSQPITIKYAFKVKTKFLSPWRVASTSVISILKATLPQVEKAALSATQVQGIWSAIVTITNSMITASPPQSLDISDIHSDQMFDINSFDSLQALIIPALGNKIVSASTHDLYTSTLFRTSLIHAPFTCDLPSLEESLVISLKKAHRGRTIDPTPSNRKDMGYVCLNALFSLVQVCGSGERATKVGGSTQKDLQEKRLSLAISAAPYLLLRCAMSIKAYTADQPLRGLCPQPLSQRQELVFILNKLIDLDVVEGAIPVGVGDQMNRDNNKCGSKKHLLALYEVLVQALGIDVAPGREEVQGLIKKALGIVGNVING